MTSQHLPRPFRYRHKWRAQVSLKNGLRPCADFDTLAAAKDWITGQLAGANSAHQPELGGPTVATLAAALRHYAGLYTLNKGGAAAELNRINHYLAGAGLHQLRLERDAHGACMLVEAAAGRALPAAWRRHREQRRAARAQTYRRIAELANKRCSAISTADLRRLLAEMQREGLSASTIQKEVALLRHLFNVAAAEWNWKGFENPCRGIRLGKSESRFVFLAPEERERLSAALAACDNPYVWPLVEVALQTALRRGSLLAMRWDQVDLAGRVAVLPSKTGTVAIPLTLRAVELLRALPRDPSGRVFPMSANAVDMAWDGVRSKAGLPGLQFRDLRHLGATAFARRGFSAHQLQKVLGHKTTAMAQVYVNLVHQDVLDAMDRSEPIGLPALPPAADGSAAEMQARRRASRLNRAGTGWGTPASVGPAVLPEVAGNVVRVDFGRRRA